MHEGKDINPVAREPVSVELTRYSEKLAARAENLAEYVHMRLLPVMNNEPPSPPSEKASDMQDWPPLFNELRANFDVVATALDRIEYALSRTEL